MSWRLLSGSGYERTGTQEEDQCGCDVFLHELFRQIHLVAEVVPIQESLDHFGMLRVDV